MEHDTDHASELFHEIVTPLQRPTYEAVSRILLDGFGVQLSDLEELAGERSANYRVTTEAQGLFLLRVSGRTHLDDAQFQAGLLRSLESRGSDSPIPRLVETRDGHSYWETTVAETPLIAQLLTWLPGECFGRLAARSPELLEDIGNQTGRLAALLAEASPMRPSGSHYWSLEHAEKILFDAHDGIENPVTRRGAETALAWLRAHHAGLESLPKALIHGDLNQFNLLVSRHGPKTRLSGIIDFGDASYTWRVADLSILLATVARDTSHLLADMSRVAAAYTQHVALDPQELEHVFGLTLTRLAVAAVTAERLSRDGQPGDTRHRAPSLEQALIRLLGVGIEVGTAAISSACGIPATTAVRDYLERTTASLMPIVTGALQVLDLSAASALFDDIDPRDLSARRDAASAAVSHHTGAIAYLRYGEPRFGGGPHSDSLSSMVAERQLGAELILNAGATVSAPLAGVVVFAEGETLALVHTPEPGITFTTVLRGINSDVCVGDTLPAGAKLGSALMHAPSSGPLGGVYVQVYAASNVDVTALPFSASEDTFAAFASLLLDPSPLCATAKQLGHWEPRSAATLAIRSEHLPPNHPTYYIDPPILVRSRGSWLFDESGAAFLDVLNNVTLVGHSHPRVVAAATQQLKRLNTNSRFVYELLGTYSERIAGLMPPGLEVVYLVNSGSEANDLALRMARLVTGRQDLITMESAYHGNTALVTEVTPARFRLTGKPGTTHVLPVPDRYRGPYGYDDPRAGERYAAEAIQQLQALGESNALPAAFIFESLGASAGQVVLPEGYVAPVCKTIHDLGGLVIADEVQVGFGRFGSSMWGFEQHGIVPDMVTLGKPMGNGFPLAALVTTHEIAAEFARAGQYFSTFGGNPVACAVGIAVLDVLGDEDLAHHAAHAAEYLRGLLRQLAIDHPVIGDVRGFGSYSGVDFVEDRLTKEPATVETALICERLRERGILVYPTGQYRNVLKIKPPMTFGVAEADFFAETLGEVLSAGW